MDKNRWNKEQGDEYIANGKAKHLLLNNLLVQLYPKYVILIFDQILS